MLYQAQWLNREIDRKPYHGYDKNDERKSQTESFDKLDPDYIREKKNVEEKMQMDEQFEERVHQIFNPLGQMANETGTLTSEMMGKVYDIQTSHEARLIKKAANKNI